MKTIYWIIILHFINLQFINAMDTQGGVAGGSGLPPRPPGGSGNRGGIGRSREGGRKRPSSQIDQSDSASGGQHSRQNPQEPTNINPANELFRTSTAGQQIRPETMAAWPSRNLSGMLNRMVTEAGTLESGPQQHASQADKGKGIVDESQPLPPSQRRSTVGGLLADARRTGSYPMGLPQHQRSSAARQRMRSATTKSVRPSQNMSGLMNRMETGRLNTRASQAHTTATNMLMEANPANQYFRSSISPIFHSGTFSESPVPGTLLCNDCNETVEARGEESKVKESLQKHILSSRKHGPRSQTATKLQTKANEFHSLNPSIHENFVKITDNIYQCKTCPSTVRVSTGSSSRQLSKHFYNKHIIEFAIPRSETATKLEKYLGDRAATNHVLQNLNNEVATLRSQGIFAGAESQAQHIGTAEQRGQNPRLGLRSVSHQIGRSQQIPDLNVATEEPMEEIEHLMIPSTMQRDQQTAPQIPVTQEMMQQLHVTQPQQGHLIEQSMGQRIASSAGQHSATMSRPSTFAQGGETQQLPSYAAAGTGHAPLRSVSRTMQQHQTFGSPGSGHSSPQVPSTQHQLSRLGSGSISRQIAAQQSFPVPSSPSINFDVTPDEIASYLGEHPTPSPSQGGHLGARSIHPAYGAPATGHTPLQSLSRGTHYGQGEASRQPSSVRPSSQVHLGTQHSSVRPSSQLAAGRSQFVSVASEYRQATFGDAGGTEAAQQSHRSGEEKPSGSGAQQNPSQYPTNYDPST